MAHRRVEVNQLMILILENKWGQIFDMIKEDIILPEDMADALGTTKSREFLTGFASALTDISRATLETSRPPPSNEAEDNKPHDKDSQDKKP